MLVVYMNGENTTVERGAAPKRWDISPLGKVVSIEFYKGELDIVCIALTNLAARARETDPLVEKLASNEYESISPQALTLDDWIKLAVLLYKEEFVSLHPGIAASTMVTRIQSLLVDAAIGIEDTEFINMLTQGVKHGETFNIQLAPDRSIISYGYSPTGAAPTGRLATDNGQWSVDLIDTCKPMVEDQGRYKAIHLCHCVRVSLPVAA